MTESIIRCLSKLSDEVASDAPSNDHVQLLGSWVANYLAQPHSDLGRAGPVCPFARPSLDRDMLWIAAVRGATPSVDGVIGDMRELIRTFLALQPDTGPDSLLKAIFIAFPDVVDVALIDQVQKALKPDFIDAGLMIGQFYEGCTEPGLWNPPVSSARNHRYR